MAEFDAKASRKYWNAARGLVGKLNKTNSLNLRGTDESIYPYAIKVEKKAGYYILSKINRKGEDPKTKVMQKAFVEAEVKNALEDGLKPEFGKQSHLE